MPFHGSKRVDPCPKGGNHNWRYHDNGNYIQVTRCTKCGSKKWKAFARVKDYEKIRAEVKRLVG